MILDVPGGSTLWRHNALSFFGSAASVWSFNGFADTLMFLGRKLLLSPVHHFVDDFAGIEPREHASSGFVGFDRVLAALGTHTKPKKAQPPATEQKLLGIVMNWREDGVELSPSADRVQRVSAIVKGCISTQRLTPHVAQRLADKLSFLTSTFFGQAGKAALHPAQARAAGLADAAGYKLNAVLSAALHSLQHIGVLKKLFQGMMYAPGIFFLE